MLITSGRPTLARGNGGVFEVSLEDEAKLLDAIAEAERGEIVSASEVLEKIRKSRLPLDDKVSH